MKASVIIPAYNAEPTIRKCLDSVINNNYNDFEIIVIDDKSSDRTAEIIYSYKCDLLRYIANGSNQKVSFTRNLGIKEANGGLILLLDSDAYVDKDWIKNHVEAHASIKADIIGGGIVGIHNTIYGKTDAFCTWFTSIPHSRSYYLRHLHLPTNNLSIKRDVFNKIGYFDESLKNGGEDTEFCFRALQSGLKIYFKSDILAYHFDRDTRGKFLEHQKNKGRYAVEVRRRRRLDYSFLLPNSYYSACLYIMPLSVFLTIYIVSRWVRWVPSVLFYIPLILIAKIKHAAAVKDTLKNPALQPAEKRV